jgi:hypothetical protein
MITSLSNNNKYNSNYILLNHFSYIQTFLFKYQFNINLYICKLTNTFYNNEIRKLNSFAQTKNYCLKNTIFSLTNIINYIETNFNYTFYKLTNKLKHEYFKDLEHNLYENLYYDNTQTMYFRYSDSIECLNKKSNLVYWTLGCCSIWNRYGRYYENNKKIDTIGIIPYTFFNNQDKYLTYDFQIIKTVDNKFHINLINIINSTNVILWNTTYNKYIINTSQLCYIDHWLDYTKINKKDCIEINSELKDVETYKQLQFNNIKIPEIIYNELDHIKTIFENNTFDFNGDKTSILDINCINYIMIIKYNNLQIIIYPELYYDEINNHSKKEEVDIAYKIKSNTSDYYKNSLKSYGYISDNDFQILKQILTQFSPCKCFTFGQLMFATSCGVNYISVNRNTSLVTKYTVKNTKKNITEFEMSLTKDGTYTLISSIYKYMNEKTELIVWKGAYYNNKPCLIKLIVPKDAKIVMNQEHQFDRNNDFYIKFRTDKVHVENIFLIDELYQCLGCTNIGCYETDHGLYCSQCAINTNTQCTLIEHKNTIEYANAPYRTDFIYTKGQDIEINDFDLDISDCECPGIYFLINRELVYDYIFNELTYKLQDSIKESDEWDWNGDDGVEESKESYNKNDGVEESKESYNKNDGVEESKESYNKDDGVEESKESYNKDDGVEESKEFNELEWGLN